MTANELTKLFNDMYGLEYPWPRSHVVYHETYANVVQEVINSKYRKGEFIKLGTREQPFYSFEIYTGPNNGIMFKGVELILEGKKE